MRFNNMLELFSILIMVCGYYCNGSNAGSETRWILSSTGYVFKPNDEQALLLSQTSTKSRLRCAEMCHSTINCRIFDYDSSSGRCRLFEGDIETMGERVIDLAYPQSIVGYIKLESKLFDAYGQPCAACQQSRFLSCINDTCQCPTRTYFNGSICQSQKLLGSRCISPNECRQDLNYTCLPREQCGPESIQNGIVVAGYGNGSSGDSMNALNGPFAIDLGQNNRMYVADARNNRILRYEVGSNSGTMVAGSGTMVSGSGSIVAETGSIVAGSGSIVAETGSIVAASGSIVAGTGSIVAGSGSMVAGSGTMVSGTGSMGYSTHQFNLPVSVAVDHLLNIYISDRGNHRVMLWLPNSSSGRVIAGNGMSGSNLNQLYFPNGIRVDRMGNLYIADEYNNRIMYYAVNATSGIIVAGTGAAGDSNRQLYSPTDLHLDEQNKLIYVLDSLNGRVQRFPMNGSNIGITVAGGNGFGVGINQFGLSYGLYVSSTTQDIYVADSRYHRIQLWRKGASYGVTVVGKLDILGISTSLLFNPRCVRLNENATIMYVCDTENNRVLKFPLI